MLSNSLSIRFTSSLLYAATGGDALPAEAFNISGLRRSCGVMLYIIASCVSGVFGFLRVAHIPSVDPPAASLPIHRAAHLLPCCIWSKKRSCKVNSARRSFCSIFAKLPSRSKVSSCFSISVTHRPCPKYATPCVQDETARCFLSFPRFLQT